MPETKSKDLNYYLSLNYSVVINKVNDDGDDYFFGRVSELGGCHTTANTIATLIDELEQVKREYLEIKLQFGDAIPEPDK
ncbi:type II toxin-antitoxin system HicB family antitoxin [Bacillus carboniphilus]|uniref:Type II toxin-antitoxin system HicB family antitoxin n=1 Tax=Bacillus carboniphilus TaxID=86663 RepID=A0ABY9JV11_9BACI|nr:type II toxin-antitoxin system HicB family antitoxin [Bacillus carboniphilus]WLR42563.1 type II toxin-antitoxin system HicB family antitoxin [Bacillus carboniphilus]